MSPGQSRRMAGFSLVELLVVIGIITLVMGLMMPAMSQVQQRSRSVVCQSNLRQCGYNLLIYADENKGWMFPVGRGCEYPAEKRWPVYVFKTWNPKVMICPEDLTPREEHSYIVNQHLADKGLKYGKTKGIPAHTIVVMGEKISTKPDYYMQFRSGATEFYGLVELYRHGVERGSNYLYLDLHVDSESPRQRANAMDPWDVPVAGPAE